MDQSESTAANPVRRSRRRWFQYSLRSFLILMTVFAVWLGVAVNRAREQREAVEAIEALGGVVQYDWQFFDFDISAGPPPPPEPSGPAWLRRLIGDDYFQNARLVSFSKGPYSAGPSTPETDILKSTPYLKRLRTLQEVTVGLKTSTATQGKLKSELPNCKVRAMGF